MEAKRPAELRTSKSSFQSPDHPDNPIILDPESTMTFPIFPLQKSVRLPTDSLVLNLYEPRYLALSEYILGNQTVPIFGALHSSDKPQLVKNAVGPIVPILDVGDTGVLCFVQDWEEGMVPCADPSVFRRRIRLNAIAVARFRIKRILHDGTVDTSSNNPPFILVEASVVVDSATPENARKERIRHFEEAFRSATQKENSEVQPDKAKEETASSTILTETDQKQSGPSLPLESLVDLVDSLVCYQSCDKEAQRSEIFSFAVASSLCQSGAPPEDMKSLLRMESTQERLERISEWI
jgi:hypothetical protein